MVYVVVIAGMVCVVVAYEIKLKCNYNNESYSAVPKIHITYTQTLHYCVRRFNSSICGLIPNHRIGSLS
jgi:hypothetical protein